MPRIPGYPPLRPLVILAALLLAGPVSAASVRTFVASTGSDANSSVNCSLAAPCRTFSAALGVTSAGGEVVALDTAGYGPVTITQAVSIEAPAGVYAGVAVPAGGSGITINAPGSQVRLEGLRVVGAAGSLNGVYIVSAASVSIVNTQIVGLTTGVNVVNGGLFMENCGISDSGGNGILVAPTTFTSGSVSAAVSLEMVVIGKSGASGIAAADGVSLSVRNSVLVSSTVNSIAMTIGTSAQSLLDIDGTFFSGNVSGAHLALQTASSAEALRARVRQSTMEFGTTCVQASGAGTTLHLDNDTLEFCSTGVANSAVVYTYNNNRIQSVTAVSGTALAPDSNY